MNITLRDFIKTGLAPFLVLMLNVVLFACTPWYGRFAVTDMIVHFLGGLSIAIASEIGFAVLIRWDWVVFKKRFVEDVFIITVVMAAAGFWEFAEFLTDYFLQTAFQPSLVDTMQDMAFGLLGGLVFLGGRKIFLIFKNK